MTEAYFEKMSNFIYRILVPNRTIISEKSDFQQIDIVESKDGSKALMLDGVVQLYTKDEFIYHEMAVHLPFTYHANPERVLVLGGGDGFLLREILKYKSVKEVVLVDIDGKVVELCRKHFAEENGNSFDDPRVKVVVGDALVYEDPGKFDVVIMDLVDPYGGGMALYTEDGIKAFSKHMKEDGILATHCEDASFPNYVGIKMFAQLSNMFPYHKAGLAHVKSFDGLWTFVVLSHKELTPRNKETAHLKLKYFEPDKVGCYTKLPPFLEEKFQEYREKGFDALSKDYVYMGPASVSDTVKDLIEKKG